MSIDEHGLVENPFKFTRLVLHLNNLLNPATKLLDLLEVHLFNSYVGFIKQIIAESAAIQGQKQIKDENEILTRLKFAKRRSCC